MSTEKHMKPPAPAGRKPAVALAKPRQVRREKPAVVPPASRRPSNAVPSAPLDAGQQAAAAQSRSAQANTPLKPEVRAAAAAPPSPQELIAPQEYDSLLRGLDHEHAPPAPQAHDDLWERLARTGWLSKLPQTPRRTTRVMQRPSA